MFIGANVSIIAIGAILVYATRLPDRGFSVPAVGAVLMIVGIVSLVLQVVALARRRRAVVPAVVAQPAPTTLGQRAVLPPRLPDATVVLPTERQVWYRR